MATLRRGLVDTVKKAATKVGARGVQAAAKAGTKGARVLVETTVAAVKTVDKLQQKLGRGANKVRSAKQFLGVEPRSETAPRQSTSRAAAPMISKAPVKAEGATPKPRRAPTERTEEAQPVELREAGRKTMPAAAPKRAKKAAAPGKQFKVKRGQKHQHSGR
jgi:hypothetical protein